MKDSRIRLFGGFLAFSLGLGSFLGQGTGAEVEVIAKEPDAVFQLSPEESVKVEASDLPGLKLASDNSSVSLVVRRFPVKSRQTYTLYVGRKGDATGTTLFLLGTDPREIPPASAPDAGTTQEIRLDPARWGDASFARYNVTIAPESNSAFLYLVAVFGTGASELVAELQSDAVPDGFVEDPDHVKNPESLAGEWRERHAAGPCSGWVFDEMLLLKARPTGLVVRAPPDSDPAAREEPFAVVRVLFGTDRKRTGETKPSEYFGTDRGEMALGSCDVSIPRDHRIGSLERPSIWKLEFRETPEKHVVILTLDEMDQARFAASLEERVKQSEKKQAFVFVHGYNVTFDSAIMRAAQVHYDLAFDGAPIAYSWPSKGNLAGYPADEATIEWTLPHLEAFLEMVTAKSGAEKIHLVAHSMGNRALVRTLVRMVEKNGALPENVDNIILTAPDIDADVFARDLVPPLVDSGKTVTLYASNSDNALIASRKVHQAPRAGDTGGGLVILAGMDTIDASGKKIDFLGHSYYANSRTVIGDLFKLIRGYSPDHRKGLVRSVRETKGIFWFFQDREAE